MSSPDQTKRRQRAAPLFDPDAFAAWRLVEAFPARLRAVRVVAARTAPFADLLDGHLHAEPTIVCCIAGTTRIETGRGILDLAMGEAAVVAPGAWHRHTPLRAGSAVYAQGLIGRRSDVLLATSARRWSAVVPEEPSRRWLAQALDGDERARRAAVAELAAQFAREPAAALEMTPAQRAMGWHLWARFTRPITVAEVLKASGLGRAQAYASFAAAFGESPKRALTRIRLALARRLLAEGLPAAEAAERSGFSTAARLRRTLRQGTAGSAG